MTFRASGLLQAAVIGYGSYGRFHVRKYRSFPDVAICGIADTNPARRAAAKAAYPDIPVHTDVDELLAAQLPQLASVAVPASAHHAVAGRLLERGVHVLVEKPLADSRVRAMDLLQLARRRKRILQPGHVERFNHTLAELRAHVREPVYMESRRLVPWTGRGGDVDVVLDLMIHDIDLLLNLFDSPVMDIQARGIRLFSGCWDVANACVVFANGCVANLTASRASLRAERRLHVFSHSACAQVDLDDGLMLLHHRDASGGISTRHSLCRHEDPLAAEIAAFVYAVREGREPAVSAEDGFHAVDIATRIADAMENDDEVISRVAAPMMKPEHAIAWLARLDGR
ncbi:MAG: Gfo/Idh/MocA family oxidoreductase [Proteobacteria bacterium]|nr:Gfo/Idh/MocA family oxidoreductase [Pseudomonadota bacterium]